MLASFFTIIFDVRKTLLIAGREVRLMIIQAIILGLFAFVIEYAFIFFLQGFLVAIKLTERSIIELPNWVPSNEKFAFIALVLIGIVRSIVLGVKSYLGGVANQAYVKNQRGKIFEYAVYFAQKTSTHKMSSLFTEVINRSGDGVIATISLATSVSMFALLFLGGLKMAPKEMLLGIFLIVIFIIPLRSLDKKITEAGRESTKAWSRLNKLLLEGVRHNMFFKAHGLEGKHINCGKDELVQYENHFKDYFLWGSTKNAIPGIIGIIALGVISYLSRMYFETKSADLFAFLYIFMRFAQAGSEVIAFSTQFKLNRPSIDIIYNWNNEMYSQVEVLHRPKSDFQRSNIVNPNLKLESVSFSYDNKLVLENINLNLGPGSKLMILGESGKGKSTLLSLLMGINRPTLGKVEFRSELINGGPELMKDSLSYIAPEPFLFEGSIRENLLYGNPLRQTITDEKIFEALSLAEIDEYVKEKKEGLDFLFEEHAEASTGQKQRLAIARAILREPQILILDESTSNIDVELEKKILDKLFEKFNHAIIVYVSHRKNLESYSTQKLCL